MDKTTYRKNEPIQISVLICYSFLIEKSAHRPITSYDFLDEGSI